MFLSIRLTSEYNMTISFHKHQERGVLLHRGRLSGKQVNKLQPTSYKGLGLLMGDWVRKVSRFTQRTGSSPKSIRNWFNFTTTYELGFPVEY